MPMKGASKIFLLLFIHMEISIISYICYKENKTISELKTNKSNCLHDQNVFSYNDRLFLSIQCKSSESMIKR